MSIAVGIDLGTTFSAIAYINEYGKPEIVKNSEGKTLTPSVVALCEAPPVVGDAAKELQAVGEEGVASFFKRAMGDRAWSFECNGKSYSATDLSCLVLKKLKEDAEAILGEQISDAVITVPAYFNNDQREATKAAGEAAGLNVLMTINEPTAAALAYGMGQQALDGKLLVYDLGGGTFDVTLMELDSDSLKVLATDGDHELGGKDWDDRLANFVASEFYEEHGEQPLDDKVSYNDVLVASEQAKINLSKMNSTRMRITHEGTRAAYEVSREQFDGMTTDLLERTITLTDNVLAEQQLQWADVHGVLLVGGSTRMPMVHAFIEERTGKEAISGVNVDEAIALGAAIQASKMASKGGGKKLFTLPGAKDFQDVTSHSLGMIALNDDRSAYVNGIILSKNQPIPAQYSRPFKLRTSARGTNTLEVFITQGESTVPNQCAFLGKYTARDIEHDPSGEAVLDITYAYDESGIVQVAGKNRKSGLDLQMAKEPLPEDMSWVELPPSFEQEEIPSHVAVCLCVDVSGSMSGEPLAEAQDAAGNFVDRMDLTSSSVGLVSFGSSGQLMTQASQSVRDLKSAISSLSITGSTNMTEGLDLSAQELNRVGSEGMRFIVLLTDGMPDSEPGTLKAAKRCHDDGIDIVAIGTSGADRDFLAKVASTDEGNIFAQSGQLVDVFGSIAQQITEGGSRLRRL